MRYNTRMLNSKLPSESEMYRALVERDASYEGIFIVGVRTTGIFCRPTCTARKPRPEKGGAVKRIAKTASAQSDPFPK